MISGYYGHTSKRYARVTEYYDLYRKFKIDKALENMKHPATLLLDSSLITQTPYQTYDTKIIECNNYIYLYDFGKTKKKRIKNIQTFDDNKLRKKIEIEKKEKIKEIEKKKNEIEEENETDKEKIKKEKKEIKLKEIKINKIEMKNINRSKFNLQMLIKSNEDIFKTFITLTFKDEIFDIVEANKKFNIFKTQIKRAYNDFSYISVPEFQKNGRIHYHLLTNIDYDDIKLLNENISFCNLLSKFNKTKYKLCKCSSFKDNDVIFFFFKDEMASKSVNFSNLYSLILFKKKVKSSKNNIKFYRKALRGVINNDSALVYLNRTSYFQKNKFNIVLRYQDNKLQNTKKTYNYKSKASKIFKTLKFWNYGYSNVVSINNINVVGYLTKYLTKDIDNRLFSFRRYTYSLNLKKPSITYLNMNLLRDFSKLYNKINISEVIYNSSYYTLNNELINFTELKVCI